MNARVNDFPFLTESRFKLKLLTSLDKENSQHTGKILPSPHYRALTKALLNEERNNRCRIQELATPARGISSIKFEIH